LEKVITLEMHYHRPDAVSVVLNGNQQSPGDEAFAEMLLFCLFTLRVMLNLGRDYENANSLAAVLSGAFKPLRTLTDNDYPNVAKLVPYQGSPGPETIKAILKYGDDIVFELEPKNFDIFGKEIEYYAINSVLVFLKYLVGMRQDSGIYCEAILRAAQECSRRYYQERLTVDNFLLNALLVANSCFRPIRESQLTSGLFMSRATKANNNGS